MVLNRTVLALFLVTICWHFAHGSYLCLMPKSFHAGWPYSLAITMRKVTNQNQPVTMQGTLVIQNKRDASITDKPIISGSIDIDEGQTKLLTLQIPYVVPDVTEDEIFYLKLGASGGLTEKSKHSVAFNKNQSVLLVQTDKNIYKPGQTVYFRILNMNKSLQPMHQPLSVFIVNPDGSKLERIDNLTSSTGVDETSFELSEYATLGTWQIQVINEALDVLHTYSFLVEEFVLPKFSVEVTFDPDYLIWNRYNPLPSIIVKSIYTYGKAVQGICKLTVSRPGMSQKELLSRKIDESGRTEFSDINWSSIVGSKPTTSKSVLAQVEVEDETGRKEEGTATILVHRSQYKVEILDSSSKILRQGLPSVFHIKVSDHDGNLVPNKQVQIKLSIASYAQRLLDAVVTREMKDGEPFLSWSYVPDNFNTLEDYEPTATIEVKLKEDSLVSDTKKLIVHRSEGQGAIQVRRADSTIVEKGKPVEFYVQSNIDTTPTTLSYMVVSQGNILMAGNIINKTITLTPSLEMCPEANLVVHMIQTTETTEEVVVDYINLAPHMCLDKRVMVSFEAKEVRTGAYTNMDIQVEQWDGSNSWTAAGSHDVYYLAVDKSIVLLQGSTDLNENKVLSSLRALTLFKGQSSRSVDSAGLTFSRLGLLHNEGQVIVFDASARVRPEPEIMFAMAGVADGNSQQRAPSIAEEDEDEESDKKVETEEMAPVVRKDFPDTWLWGKAETGSNGRYRQPVRLPDTITSWQVSAFAINAEGVAYAGNPYELTGYQPFFLSMNLPYSIKRGEIFKLRITVFNYRQDNVDATVRLKLSEMFNVINGDFKDGWSEIDLQIKPSLASSVEFLINASRIGEMELEAVAEDKIDGQRDQVIRKLLVKPEGEERMEAITNVMVLNEDEPLTKFFQINWPYDEIVADSQRLQVKITGETMGQALNGLEKLVTMPYGCGEQNMISTVPNIYGLMYIKSTDQKNMEDTIENLLRNMRKGYQREVDQFRHSDGSYSAWGGKSGDKGSTWLTAFVIKSFAQASRYMTVDSDILNQGMQFILSKQNRQGDFREDGKVLHKNLQKGTGESLGMTVYALLSMLEMQDVLGGNDMDDKIQLATSYIISTVGRSDGLDDFLSSITAYALSLLPSRDSSVEETIAQLLTRLENSEGAVWNEIEGDEKKSTLTIGLKPTSIQLQTAAYMLLTYIRLDENWKALNLMKWMQSKQNAMGGFVSTQDTVLVLQALSETGRYLGKSSKNAFVTVDVPEVGLREEVDISGDRSILLQIVDVPASVNLINVTLSGEAKAMAVVKVAYYYYTLVEDQDDSETGGKSVEVKTLSYRLGNSNRHQVQACVKSSLVEETEMYVTSLHLPSGENSINTPSELLAKNPGTSRVETEEGTIHFYMDTIPEKGLCLQAEIESQVEFTRKQPGSAKVYPYYDPEISAEVSLALDNSVVCTSDPCDGAVTLTGLFLSVIICTLISLLMCM